MRTALAQSTASGGDNLSHLFLLRTIISREGKSVTTRGESHFHHFPHSVRRIPRPHVVRLESQAPATMATKDLLGQRRLPWQQQQKNVLAQRRHSLYLYR